MNLPKIKWGEHNILNKEVSENVVISEKNQEVGNISNESEEVSISPQTGDVTAVEVLTDNDEKEEL